MPAPYSLETSVVAAPGQLSTTLGDEVVILGLHDTVYYGLSAAGTLIWHRLQEKCSVDQIASAIVSEFDVTRERALADLQALLADLESRGLITVDDTKRH